MSNHVRFFFLNFLMRNLMSLMSNFYHISLILKQHEFLIHDHIFAYIGVT